MNKIRLGISVLILTATVTFGFASISASADVAPLEGAGGECNCIDGFSHKEGIFGWDPEQQRNHCIPGCYVVTEQ